jgi:hypothetical protein
MLSRVDLGKHKELEDDICELKKELDESTCREAELQEENSILLADVQKYKRQYKEERKKMRTLCALLKKKLK